MDRLIFTSCLAHNTEPVNREIAAYLSDELELECVFDVSAPWEQRFNLLYGDNYQVGWICGLPYTVHMRTADPSVHLLAAPVMSHPRYENRPVYYSDVVVKADSSFKSFADLRGASWAYNDDGSQSGYNVTLWHLANLGQTEGYFGRTVASGGHMKSLQMVLDGDVDASAIDSTIMDWELAHNLALGELIRVIEVLGPSPIPPWVVSRKVPGALVARIQHLLLHMHENDRGRAILDRGMLSRFVPTADSDYDVIREMAVQAARATLV